MQTDFLSRRSAFARAGFFVGAALVSDTLGLSRLAGAPTARENNSPFRFCLNTATIRGQKLGIAKEVEIAAQAGYDSIEPWVDGLEDYVKKGGKLKELRERIADAGLTVEGA